jgi:hypothetical protein
MFFLDRNSGYVAISIQDSKFILKEWGLTFHGKLGEGGLWMFPSVILGVFLHVLVLYKFIVFNSYMYITGTYLYVCFLDIWDYDQICCK